MKWLIQQRANSLKEGDRVLIADVVMVFSHWDEGSPVFNQEADPSIQYIDRKLNALSFVCKL